MVGATITRWPFARSGQPHLTCETSLYEMLVLRPHCRTERAGVGLVRRLMIVGVFAEGGKGTGRRQPERCPYQ